MKRILKAFIISILLSAMIFNLSGCGESTDSNIKSMGTELKKQNGEYDFCKYSIKDVDGKKQMTVEFHYENDTVFSKETQTAIRDSVEKYLSGKYNESSILINIFSDQSPTVKQYTYENGKWDKKIE